MRNAINVGILLLLVGLALYIPQESDSPFKSVGKWLVLTTISIGIGTWAGHNVSRDKEKEVASRLEGLDEEVSVGVSRKIEEMGAKLSEEKALPEMPQELLTSTLSDLAGTDAISNVLVDTVLKSPLYYRDYIVNVKLSQDHNGDPIPEDDGYLLLDAEYEFDVVNPSSSQRSYHSNAVFYDFASPDGKSLGTLSIVAASYKIIDGLGKETTISDDNEGKIEEKVKYNEKFGNLTYPLSAEIPGHSIARYKLKFRGYESKNDGDLTVFVTRKTDKMKLNITFPDEHYRPLVSHMHSKREVGSDCISGVSGRVAFGEILTGLLPYQGIMVTWKGPED